MKKTLITILIIVILAGGGYFAYTKGLINLDFLKNKKVETINEVTNEDDSLNTHKVVVSGGVEEGSDIDQSEIKPWHENSNGYIGIYNFGYSEGENSIEISFKNDNFTAINKSAVYNNTTNQFDELKVSFNDVRIVGNKFYSKEFNGEFVNFLYESQNRKGLRLYGYASRFDKTKETIDEIGFYIPTPTSFQDDDFVSKALDSLTVNNILAIYGPQNPKIVEIPNKYNKALKDQTIFYYIKDDFFVFFKTADKEFPLRGSIQSDKFTLDGIKVGMSKDLFTKKFNKKELTDLVQIHELESFNIFTFHFDAGVLKSIEYSLYYVD